MQLVVDVLQCIAIIGLGRAVSRLSNTVIKLWDAQKRR